MILVDTSIWVDHLRHDEATLSALLNAGRVLTHPFVIGELMLGGLRKSGAVVAALRELPRAVTAADEEMPRFIDRQALAGAGIDYVDAHLLAAVALTQGASLWSRDQRLSMVAARLGLAASLPH
jgi:predicted nucleic acid-binding protein